MYAAHQVTEHTWRQHTHSATCSDDGQYQADSMNGHYEDGHYDDGHYEAQDSYHGPSISQQQTQEWMQQLDGRQDAQGG